MEYPAAGLDHDPVTGQLRAPAKVDLFHMREEIAVETAQLPENIGPHHHAGARGPKHVAGSIVLSVVLLDRIEDTPPAERITECVEKSAAGSRILEIAGAVVRKDFRGEGRNPFIGSHQFRQRTEPSLFHFDIGVQQYVTVGRDLLQRPVIPFGIAVILIEQQQLHLWIVLAQERRRIVVRSVVGHHDRSSGTVRHDRGQETLEVGASVPVQDDDLNFHKMRCKLIEKLTVQALCAALPNMPNAIGCYIRSPWWISFVRQ